MRASTTTDSPSPRRHHTKASIATLVAFCALAAGAQALAPASASAAISQPGACIPAEGAPLGWGKDSNGQDCLLKIEVIEVSGTAPPNAPSWLDQLEDCLRNPRCISGSGDSVPDLDGQHIDVVGWYRRLFRRKPPPMQPRPTLVPKPKVKPKAKVKAKPPLTPECGALLAAVKEAEQRLITLSEGQVYPDEGNHSARRNYRHNATNYFDTRQKLNKVKAEWRLARAEFEASCKNSLQWLN